MEKSYVSIEAKVCPVCGKTHTHDTGILIDRWMRNSLEHETITGYGLCEEHDRMFKEGYIALVEVDESKSDITKDDTIRPENAYRTGNILHVKKELCRKIIPSLGDKNIPMAYIKRQAFQYIKILSESTTEREEENDSPDGDGHEDAK